MENESVITRHVINQT